MPYLGTQAPTGFKTTTKQSFSGDNSTTAFTLNRASSSATDLEIFVDNIQQEPTTAYSVSGTTLTFTEAPPTGTNNVYVVNRGGDQNGLLPPQDLGTTDYIFGDDISFNSDGAVINFGADSDINLTHVADTGLTTNNDFSLKSDSSVLKFGNDEEITITHVADTGLNIKHTATGDDKPIILTLQTGETDIAANDVIGTINFQAPDEGTGTDAILVAAGIEAVSEGDFSSSSNATKLSFKTGSSETATEKMSIASTGATTITVSDNSDTLTLVSTDADANVGPVLNLFRDSASPADNDLIGRIVFKADDDAGNAATFARIEATATDVSNGSEDGRLDFFTAKDDAFNADLSLLGNKVGINTTSPDAQLVIARSSGSSDIAKINLDSDSIDFFTTGKTFNFGTTDSTVIRFFVDNSEAARFHTNGRFSIGASTTFDATNAGVFLSESKGFFTRGSDAPVAINRLTNDGNLVELQQDSNTEGTISVSGSTVSYNGFSGLHESSGIPTDTPIGTVVSTIDELDVYSAKQNGMEGELVDSPKAGQPRTDHAKVEVSDTVGDSAVYGVVGTFNLQGKVNIISVGIGSVRVTGACAKGDLLESNGDGTAKVQDDDIIRSKTIGKVTIGNSNTGVKLVSCVLYCG